MEMENSIAAEVYCTHYHIDLSFVQALARYGLLTTATTDDQLLLQAEQLPQLEKYTRLHYDLHINLEGIEAIAHLLNRVENLQKEMMQLRNRLSVYEV